MKKGIQLTKISKFLFRTALKYRRILPKAKCSAFESINIKEQPAIQKIYVINLDRQPKRLSEIKYELGRLITRSGKTLWELTERYPAADAKEFLQDPLKDGNVDPIYTLGDQLFVEPQPTVIPTQIELDSPIRMSWPEIAVARSHIDIWRRVAVGIHDYVLVLEDDVWFRPGFSGQLEQAWTSVIDENNKSGVFDMLYLSYEEVKNGAPKTFLSNDIFSPERGLWNLSGYVISKSGAQKLLQLLPCQGPIDLWINHQFHSLRVLAIKKSVINQRPDLKSTNSYSILPSLTKIGAINSEVSSLFQNFPKECPVFAFGTPGSGLSSIAMALSMLGYRCCNDLDTLPKDELEKLYLGQSGQVFNAYVNILTLFSEVHKLKVIYPKAKFIVTVNSTDVNDIGHSRMIEALGDVDTAIIDSQDTEKWKTLCKHLRCVPPACLFPKLIDLGFRQVLEHRNNESNILNFEIPKRDFSPWVLGDNKSWKGVNCVDFSSGQIANPTSVKLIDAHDTIDKKHWIKRDDTFTDNLALFRPANIELSNGIATFVVNREHLGVRDYSAASITSQEEYLYGRFETTIKAAKVPGVITGFFLHRNSPRQEIDIEITGNRTDRLLVNVFYNPGTDGAKFDYGYRGAPTSIELGFDASESYHHYSIEWDSSEIRWFVDNHLVHKRVNWDPTPVPNLPMSLHLNVWPCRSRELAGRLSNSRFPATTFIKSIEINANKDIRL